MPGMTWGCMQRWGLGGYCEGGSQGPTGKWPGSGFFETYPLVMPQIGCIIELLIYR